MTYFEGDNASTMFLDEKTWHVKLENWEPSSMAELLENCSVITKSIDVIYINRGRSVV